MLADSSENSSDSCYDIRYAWRVRFVARSRITSASMINWPELPDCGVYLFWPEEGTDWIHPDDLSIVQGWIPSPRVFRRHSYDGVYYRLQYGVDVLRVKPTLWLKVTDEGFWVGDQVEVRGLLMDREPCIATISEMTFDRVTSRIPACTTTEAVIGSAPIASPPTASGMAPNTFDAITSSIPAAIWFAPCGCNVTMRQSR